MLWWRHLTNYKKRRSDENCSVSSGQMFDKLRLTLFTTKQKTV